MKLLLKLAWRDLWRNKRRTILTILAVFFAVFLSVISKGFSDGIWEYSLRTTIEMFSGFLQIQYEGYEENPSLDKSVPYDDSILSILRDDDSIPHFAPRILGNGLISFGENSLGAMIIGVDPLAEENLSRFQERVREGTFLNSVDSEEVVLGHTLMKNLNASIGDSIVLLAQDRFGSMGNMRFRIAGTVGLGAPEFDQMAAFLGLGTAQELLWMDNEVSMFVLTVDTIRRLERIRENLTLRLRAAGYESLDVLTWEETLPEMKQAMEFDQIGDNIFLGILIIIVAFGILNTILMSVTERFREFGVNLAVGMPQWKLVALVLIESFFIALMGIVLGNIAGFGINYYFYINPIELGGDFAELYELYGIEPLILTSIHYSIFLSLSVFVLVISFLASLYPSYKVYKLEPLKGIRYT